MKKQKNNKSKNTLLFRREFLGKTGTLCAAYSIMSTGFFPKKLFSTPDKKMKEALYWKKLADNNVKCSLCINECTLSHGKDGTCHARGNRNGKLYSLVYNKPSIIAIDNIEKSPLYHFQPNSKVLSIATAGCNLACSFCQNFKYSQSGPTNVKNFHMSPKDVIARAKKHKVNSINFFYTEPVIYFEYMKDIAELAKKEKIKTVCVTAGFINDKPLKELIPLIDAFVFGLKGFDNAFYEKYIGCKLEDIKKSLKTLSEYKTETWFEIVNLLVPTLNDSTATINEMCMWLKQEIGTEIPLHFTRFEPKFKLKDLKRTPIPSLKNAFKLAKQNKLKYVYIGNLPGHDENSTVCPRCKKIVIERVNFKTLKNSLKNGKCSCGYKLEGRWGST